MKKTHKLKVTKLTNKVDGLDVMGQGCGNDCKKSKWSGKGCYDCGCSKITYTDGPKMTKYF